MTAESRGGSSQSSPAPTSSSGQSPLLVQGCELVAPAGHVVKLCRGLKLGWSVDKSHGRVAWSTAQGLFGSRGSFINFGFGFWGLFRRWAGVGKASLGGKAIKRLLVPILMLDPALLLRCWSQNIRDLDIQVLSNQDTKLTIEPQPTNQSTNQAHHEVRHPLHCCCRRPRRRPSRSRRPARLCCKLSPPPHSHLMS